jgi:enamine deaminase RidA (YjgF/YER057c/UK114 family)
VWCDWVDPDNKPARACVEALMANPVILFEVMVIAAK